MAAGKKRSTKKSAVKKKRSPAVKKKTSAAAKKKTAPRAKKSTSNGKARPAVRRAATTKAAPQRPSVNGNTHAPHPVHRASGPPYLHYVGSRHGVPIWIVDGAYVRKNIDEEFSNFGHHFSIPEIPRDEIWLDREAHPDEQRFFIAHAVIERRCIADGKSYDDARHLACDAEYRLREHTRDLRHVAPGKSLPEADRVHVRLRKALNDGTAIWIVDGRLVRTVFDIEFTEGGHEFVYEFVPHGQVWIDDDITEEEIGYVILHEMHERNLMARGMPYDAAHASASKLELHCRRHPHLLHAALADEGWE